MYFCDSFYICSCVCASLCAECTTLVSWGPWESETAERPDWKGLLAWRMEKQREKCGDNGKDVKTRHSNKRKREEEAEWWEHTIKNWAKLTDRKGFWGADLTNTPCAYLPTLTHKLLPVIPNENHYLSDKIRTRSSTTAKKNNKNIKIGWT